MGKLRMLWDVITDRDQPLAHKNAERIDKLENRIEIIEALDAFKKMTGRGE